MDQQGAIDSDPATKYGNNSTFVINISLSYAKARYYSEILLYKPHFDFDTSSEYQKRILTNHQRQKQLIKDKGLFVISHG